LAWVFWLSLLLLAFGFLVWEAFGREKIAEGEKIAKGEWQKRG
jgi:hypothetical protein